MFIKTWFAFISTLREMHPAEIPYYQATGDSRYITPYKKDFSENLFYLLNYADIKYNLYEVYKHGIKIIADRYPRFIVDDFYSLNISFKETVSEEFSIEGGFEGRFVCVVKCATPEKTTAAIMCTDRTYRTKVAKKYAPINISVDHSVILSTLVATVYKGNIIKNLIMDCQSYTKYRPNETTGGIFVSWRRKEELPTGA